MEDAFSEPLSLCISPPFAYIEFAQVKNLSVVVTTNEFQNSCIFSFKIFRIYKRTDGSFTVHAFYYLKTKTRSENVHYGKKMKNLNFLVGVLGG